MRRFYQASGSGPVDVKRLAKLLGRKYASVAVKASRIGLGSYARAKVAQPELPMLGKMTPQQLHERLSQSTRERWATRGHPKGMLGKKHNDETIAKLSDASRRMWLDPECRLNSPEHRQQLSDRLLARPMSRPGENTYSRCARGRRPDLGDAFFRSAWEANYARYLELLKSRGDIVSWEYEPRTFWFEQIKRGVRSYMPDFMLTYPNGNVEWHEVKGWMDPKSKTKLDRMRRYYPSEVVKIIGEEWFRSAKKSGLAHVIPGWE